MTITKFTHSCLLVEDGGVNTLLDPGEFSWGAVLKARLETLDELHYIGITHDHPDHFVADNVQAVIKMFPDVKVMCGPAVAKLLSKDGVVAETKSNDYVTMHIGQHQKLHSGIPEFENTQIMLDGRLLALGDSMHPEVNDVEILTAPFFGPWFEGTFSDAMELILRTKPKHVIPVHDWHYNDQARKSFHERARDFFTDKGTLVHPVVDGQALDLG